MPHGLENLDCQECGSGWGGPEGGGGGGGALQRGVRVDSGREDEESSESSISFLCVRMCQGVSWGRSRAWRVALAAHREKKQSAAWPLKG